MRYPVAQEPEYQVTTDPDPDEFDLPAGDHPLEVAARRGFGPLSPIGSEVWHGQAQPCVSCGQLVERDTRACDACGQDLSEEMLEKMRQHAGPWYVLEHLRPFPGVSLERIVRQIRRGLITETSIVRGPATDYQWRFAVETPSLCRYFNRCWNCHHEVSPADTYCPSCLTHLSFQRFPEPRAPEAARPAAGAGGTQPIAGIAVGRPLSTAELTKPLEVRPEYLQQRPVTASSSLMAGAAPVVSHPRPELAREMAVPLEPRAAAPISTHVGIPDSPPTFPSRDRAVVVPLQAQPAAFVGSAFSSRDREVSDSPGRGATAAFSTGPGSRATLAQSTAPKPASPELARLATAVASFDQVEREPEPSPGLPRAAWIAGTVVVIAIVVLIALARS